MRQHVVGVLRADLALAETYSYRAEVPLACPITVYGGREDPVFRQAHPDGWRRQTSGPFRMRWFPGSHFFLREQRDPLLDDIIGQLAGGVLDSPLPL
jgi:medium-chain acyl-[acyl-carrier-protein] hydrolase